MKPWSCLNQILIFCGLCMAGSSPPQASALPQEYETTTPVLADGVLYVASSEYPSHRGHLRAIDILGTFPLTLWDAAERMPLAGTGAAPGDLPDSDPPASIRRDNRYRSIITNLGGAQLPFTADEAQRLQSVLGAASPEAAEVLVHAVRGRRGGSLERAAGNDEDPQRLWSISRSSPVLVGKSPVSSLDGHRERVLYAGAEDGMLHAFFVSRWNAEGGSYLIDDPEGGVELWAFLPGSFLPHLKAQPLDDLLGDPAVHLDGTPVVREQFLDLDGDGLRRWHTLLVATGTVLPSRHSCLFVMDITDPYQPGLLWERLLPGDETGRTRGIAVDRCSDLPEQAECLYLTADFAGGDNAPGIHALALELVTGELLWQFSSPYAASGLVAGATPAVPALMDLDGDDRSDTLIFGDLAGRLWALALADGQPYGEAPVYQVPGGAAEPIGAGVAVYGRVAIFGTGGVAGSDDSRQYAVYAVEIGPGESRLRWIYALAAGEKVWETPLIETSGRLVFGTAVDYTSLDGAPAQTTSGRVVALDGEGTEELSQETAAAVVGGLVSAPGVTVAVALTGEATQFGSASRLTVPSDPPGSVRILSWRER
jgi:outer membrane protein assembly factor BamB